MSSMVRPFRYKRCLRAQRSAPFGCFHSIQANTQPKGADPDAKAFFDSLRVNKDKNRAIVTADVPVGFLKKIANGATER